MIPYYKLTRLLNQERVRLTRHELDTEFMRGMVQGLLLALSLAAKLWQETKNRHVGNPSGFKRSLKEKFYVDAKVV